MASVASRFVHRRSRYFIRDWGAAGHSTSGLSAPRPCAVAFADAPRRPVSRSCPRSGGHAYCHGYCRACCSCRRDMVFRSARPERADSARRLRRMPRAIARRCCAQRDRCMARRQPVAGTARRSGTDLYDRRGDSVPAFGVVVRAIRPSSDSCCRSLPDLHIRGTAQVSRCRARPARARWT